MRRSQPRRPVRCMCTRRTTGEKLSLDRARNLLAETFDEVLALLQQFDDRVCRPDVLTELGRVHYLMAGGT